MLSNRFLSFVFFTVFFQVSSYAQFDLVKDFDGGAQNSFAFNYSGMLYSVGSRMLVQYDSVLAGNYTGKATLAAVDATGNRAWLTFTSFDSDYIPAFFDFKTLPDGRVAFVAIESAVSYKIFVTDGTTAGTTAAYSTTKPIHGLELIDNGLYFTCDGDPNHALMKIEPASLAVTEVAAFGYFRNISDISKVSDTQLIFMAPDAGDDNILKLYVSDGTAGGTTALAVIHTGSEFSQNTVMTQVGNKVFFFYKLPGTDCCNDLWVTDGTVAGSKKIKEFNIVYFSDFVRDRKAIAFNNRFYFAGVETGANANTDEVLWVSDGTSAGTIALTEPADNSMHPRYFTVFQDALYFITFNGTVYENKLYKTDGTVAGTAYVELKHGAYTIFPYELAADADYLYLGAGNANAPFGSELFRYDGSETQCAMLEGIEGGQSAQPNNLYVHEGTLYFSALVTPATGEELYTTGGDFIQGIATDTRSAAALNSVLYPNPAKDAVTVASSEKIISLRLINPLGGVVAETTGTTLDVSSYAPGIYTVEILFANTETAYQKLVVNK